MISGRIQRDIWRRWYLLDSWDVNSNPLLAKLALDNEAKHTATMSQLVLQKMLKLRFWNIPHMTDFWGLESGWRSV